VDIGLPKKGFLYLSELENLLNSGNKQPGQAKKAEKGQEVLVQVVKESFGTKGPRLSCEIGLAGRYLVLMPQDKQIGISRRIESDEERKRLRQILSESRLPQDAGFIVRTAAAGSSKQDLASDAKFLSKLWQRLEKIMHRKSAPSLIYEEYDLTLRVIRDSFTSEVSKVIVDSKPEFYRIQRFMSSFLGRDLTRRLELYRGDDLFAEKDLEKQVHRIFESKIYLKSKAYIIIEPTEGLVVIDVNSGGFKKKLGQEDMAFRVNSEAAEEVARQLILRDLGGIIVIDFIDMERENHRRQVLHLLKNALSKDKAKYDILGISKFGLVEMTRERVHNTVQAISYQSCPYCQGRGKIKSPLTMSIYALKELKRFLRGSPTKEVEVALNPSVYDEISKDRDSVRFIERKFRTKINLTSNPILHVEDIKIT
jgi:ribonuclease G